MSLKLNQVINPKIIIFTLMILALIALSGRPSGMLTGHPIQFDLDTDNYVGTYNFQLIIHDSPIDVFNTEFVSVSGAGSATTADKKGELKTSYDPVKVGRIYKGIDALYAWRLEVENGVLNKYDITIVMMNSGFEAVRSMTLINAWPSQWQFPDLDTTNSGPAVELMVFEADSVFETAP